MIKGDYGRRSRSRALFLNDLLIGRASSSIFNASVLGLNDFTKFSDIIKKQHYSDDDQCFIATVYKPDARYLKEELKTELKTTIFIGPEGGFSPEEITLSLENNFLPVKLGASRLRTETAGVVACHTMNLFNGV